MKDSFNNLISYLSAGSFVLACAAFVNANPLLTVPFALCVLLRVSEHYFSSREKELLSKSDTARLEKELAELKKTLEHHGKVLNHLNQANQFAPGQRFPGVS